MKKRNLIFVLPLISVLAACGSTPTTAAPTETPTEAPIVTDLEEVLYNLLDNINVEINGAEKITWDEPYSYLNEEKSFRINCDYSTIIEADGSKTPAVRDNLDASFPTYFRGEDGGTVYEVLNPDNTVEQKEFKINYNKVNFNEMFSNPFNYIDVTDFDEEYNLNPVKASFIVSTLTGINRYAKSAQLVIDGNHATGINFEFSPRVDGHETTDGLIHSTSNFELSIKFNYDVAPITHLTPRTGADEKITAALTNKDNFTMTFNTDLLTARATVFVTENEIYLQNDIDSVGPTDGDMFFRKIGENEYESYIYKSNVEKFNLDSLSVKKSAILPDLSVINPNILLNSSDSIYYLDKIAGENSLNKFLLPNFPVQDGLGVNGTLKLDENNNISSLRATFNPTQPFTVTQNYFNYGSTSIPSWLDVDSIR